MRRRWTFLDIHVEAIPADRTLAHMLDTGEIDALYTAEPSTCFDRRSPACDGCSRTTLPSSASFSSRRMFPIMHPVVIQRDLYEAAPWIAAFSRPLPTPSASPTPSSQR